MFVTDVARARKLDPNKSSEYADAHIFTAAQAQKVGLVDSIGVEYDAKKRVETLSKVTDPIWNKEDPMDKFFKRFAAEGASLTPNYWGNWASSVIPGGYVQSNQAAILMVNIAPSTNISSISAASMTSNVNLYANVTYFTD
jgi:ClpP class serine protease